jgi:hypothetical protein
MSLQMRVPEVVGEWLAVPKTQRNNFMHFSRLLNPRSLVLLLEVRDRNLRQCFCGHKSKHAGIKIKLPIDRSSDIFRLSEAMLLSLKQQIRHRQTLLLQGIHH